MKRYVHNIPAARRLRRPQTPTETILWEQLRDRRFMGLKFRRQHAVYAYVLDFYCDELRLAIEVDGGVHNDPAQQVRDRDRQTCLEREGILFLRVSAQAIERDIEGVLSQIAALTPNPSPDKQERGADRVHNSPSPVKSGEGAGG